MEKKKSKLWLIVVAAIIIFAGVIWAVFPGKSSIVEKAMMAQVEAFNKTAPMQLDDITRIDSIAAPSPNVLKYYYTIDMANEAYNYDTIKNQLPQMLIDHIKGNAAAKLFKDNGVFFVHMYRGTDGNLFLEYTVTPEMYNE